MSSQDRKRLAILVLRYGVEYVLPALLFILLLSKILGGAIFGEVPRPQIPPDGYVAFEQNIMLYWSSGDHEGPYRIQVAKGGDFDNLVFNQETQSTRLRLPSLDPGKKYCWRVLADDDAVVSCFRTYHAFMTY